MRREANKTRKDLADVLEVKYGLTALLAMDMVDTIFETSREWLIDGFELEIRNFATFRHVVTKAKAGQNIALRQTIRIPSKNRIKCVVSKTITSEINK